MSTEPASLKGFTHLHLHTEYSLLDGAIRIRDLAAKLKELGMSSCAVTDHGVMYGTVDFFREMQKEGIHPILGCECYVAPRSRLMKEGAEDREPHHLVLLAKDQEGLINLNRLVSRGFTEGFYYRPRIDFELLVEHHKGLIALSACLAGEIPQAILREEFAKAKEIALKYAEVFGKDHFYLEIQSNQIPAQARVNQHLIRISNETGIPLVATNDCHYLERSDAEAHDILLCMQTGKRVSDTDRMRMPTDDFYVKSEAEMLEYFANVPSAIENTSKIASMCHAGYTFGHIHLPTFEIPPLFDDHVDYLRLLSDEGLRERISGVSDPDRIDEYRHRLDYELNVINEMGYTDYYLVVWDFIKYARDHGIIVGPGRGSGAGSLVAYALGITNIDPIRYGLIFERFLNSERVSMPDFDIDFCYERRQEVIDYVTEKYGKDRVAQVITFGTLAARACVRDVARALDVPYAQSDRMAKMIPAALGMTIQKALDIAPELKGEYDANPIAKQVLDTAMKFEGMPRHASTHAAGVVISSVPLTDLAPLAKNEDAVVVQFDKNNVEAIGLLKFDFLGLRTLTVMRDTAEMVMENRGAQIDFDRIPMDDPNIFEMISKGDTEGVFQLESAGMTSFMKELAPTGMEDIIAGISLYRPGPMEQIPKYVKSRHDPSQIRYSHPLLEPILNVTYGCMVYQEQVMQIVRDLAGFSMGQSDNIRRAMSKKKASIMENYRKTFIYGGYDELKRKVDGAIMRGVPEKTAEKIFDEVSHFAGYAFNKSHAAAYAVVGYFTAYLKYYYPTEFMAAMLNSYRGNLSQAAWYIGVCKRMGITVLPPDINASLAKFTTEGEGRIRIGLSAIKNVGEAAINRMIDERKLNGLFLSFGDFLRRMDRLDVNKKMVESLIFASALDLFGIPRAKLIAASDPFIAQLQNARKHLMEGQLSLFSMDGPGLEKVESEPQYPNIEEFSTSEILAREKEVLGIYVSGHPLEGYTRAIARQTSVDSSMFRAGSDEDSPMTERSIRDQERAIMAGLVVSYTTKTTKKQDLMAFVQMEDITGMFEVIVFPNTYQQYASMLKENRALLVTGKISMREDEEPKLIAEKFEDLAHNGDDVSTSFPDNRTQTPPPPLREKNSPGRIPKEPVICVPEDVPPTESDDNGLWEVSADESIGRQKLAICYHGSEKDSGYARILAALGYFRGTVPVLIYFSREKRTVELPDRYAVELSDDILREIIRVCGRDNVVIV
ncbi:MAG: DNA polymerase III subunit alpha [Clostridiales bacterium]|nr:DNA polymerase III subunit alpha [Clostridiales bacterium]